MAGETDFEPGQFVRHPGEPGWGLGQVQSAQGAKVTVNFAEAGKRTINTDVVVLMLAEVPGDAPRARDTTDASRLRDGSP